MFDRIHVNHHIRQGYPSTVKEYRAPTEESIRLAEEYRDQTRKDLVCSYKFDNPNALTGQVSVFKDTAADQEIVCARFVLNGKEHYFECISKRIERLWSEQEALRLLCQKMGEEIVKRLVSGSVK